MKDVKTELDFLLDELTPFYQSRMAELPQQEGKLLETMALMTEGCTPTELAHEARMTAKVVRALMTRLEQAGYIRREQRRQKRTVYIIPERFFRLWHQMNHSRAARGRIQYLLEFFSSWYATKAERDQVWAELLTKFENEHQIGDEDHVQDLAEYMKYVAAVSEGDERFVREFDLLRQKAERVGVHAVKDELRHLDREYQDDGGYFFHKGYFLANDLKLHQAALVAFRAAIDLKKESISLFFNQAVALDKLGRQDEARQAYEKVEHFLMKGDKYDGVDEAQKMLTQILREETNLSIVRVVAYLLGRKSNVTIDKDIEIILKNSEVSWRRQHCATVLGFLGCPESLPILIEALENEASNVRGSAATALGHIGSESAVPALIAVLDDEDSITRGSAATALGRIGSESAVPALIAVLDDRDNITRRSAAVALGRIRAEQAIEPLLMRLQDDVQAVRVKAVAALGKIASEKAIPDISLVIDFLLEEIDELPPVDMLRTFLQSVFRSADLGMIGNAIDIVWSRLPSVESWCQPYTVAFDYLQSDRRPAVLERQHPEMREAVQLLVDLFDERQTVMFNDK